MVWHNYKMRVVALKFIFEMTPLCGVVLLKLIFEPTVCRFKHFHIKNYFKTFLLSGIGLKKSETIARMKVVSF